MVNHGFLLYSTAVSLTAPDKWPYTAEGKCEKY
jgi:hypothetical protein